MQDYFLSRRNLLPGGSFGWKPSVKPHYVRMERWRPDGSPAFRLDPAQWAREVHASSKSNDVLILVHGFNIKQNQFMGRVSKFRQAMQAGGYKGAIIGFDWPANGRIFDYEDDRRDAKDTAASLVFDGIGTLLKHKPSARIHILAHSMGCYVTSLALAAATGTPMEARLRASLRQVVFIAADTDQDWSKEQAWVAESLRRCAGRFTNYHSIHDQILHVSETQYNRDTKRLGRAGLDHPAADHVVNVDAGKYYLDAYRFNHWPLLSHNWQFTDALFRKDVMPVLAGDSPATQKTRAKLADDHFVLKSA